MRRTQNPKMGSALLKNPIAFCASACILARSVERQLGQSFRWTFRAQQRKQTDENPKTYPRLARALNPKGFALLESITGVCAVLVFGTVGRSTRGRPRR